MLVPTLVSIRTKFWSHQKSARSKLSFRAALTIETLSKVLRSNSRFQYTLVNHLIWKTLTIMADTLRIPSRRNPNAKVIAHRGGALEAPENTIGALKRALEIGAHGVEFDLQRTNDGHLIILHDDTLERTAVPFSEEVGQSIGLERDAYLKLIRTNVNKLCLHDIQSVDIGSCFGPKWSHERVALFEDALKLLKLYPEAVMYAEIKSGDNESATIAADVVKKHNPSSQQLWFISFQIDVLLQAKRLIPQYKMMHVLKAVPKVTDDFLERIKISTQALNGVDPCALPSTINEQVVHIVKDELNDKTLACWVTQKLPQCDSPQNWSTLLHLGVDAITTDRPTELLEFIHRDGIDTCDNDLSTTSDSTQIRKGNE